ncbi:MAG: hypothetical protein R3240_09195, partial [Gammaproteobacteria bacterium]|nr:hypothetical protein [Gammaproteobacteria bacterium]
MMYTFIKTLIVVSFISLSGCASQEEIPENVSPDHISEAVKQHINSTLVVVSLEEDARLGMPVSGQGTSHQYYGVIGKLAESGTVRYAKDLSEEHRQLLRGIDKVAFRFDTGTKFRTAIGEALRSIDWLHISSVVNQTDLPMTDIEHMVQTQDEDALLLIDNRYLMAIDFSSITVFSYVTLYAHNEALVKIAKAARPYDDPPTLYQKLFTFEYPYEAGRTSLDDSGNTTPDEALKGWN